MAKDGLTYFKKRKPPQTNVRALTADGTLTDMDGRFVYLLYTLNIYLDHFKKPNKKVFSGSDLNASFYENHFCVKLRLY